MAESAQHKLDRIRPPRVQITYDVEIGNALEKRELPLVVGIMSDLAGKQEKPLPKLGERRFVEIDRDNFNQVMSSLAPRVTAQVDNALSDDGSKLNVELNFSHIDDFDPVSIVNQVKPLRRLYEARQKLRDLLTKLDGNDDLDKLLQDVMANTEELQKIRVAKPDAPSAAKAESPAAPKAEQPASAAPAAEEAAPEPEAPAAE
ncbi:type VI secretion system contractile sheath small subunit [Chromobacterium sp. IIBBL 290-4]|uniref:type VI secretion system contractile sheath small subunit n=1 Tax=Chromobacterium sp. IIBBL 290-4 TaxID=2953890 RepID=UPI0020B6ECBF|nr:type VI secretion system contractile sheath small subunit [Chromobacterium sp. IIBBL 290-4]UTH75144.1 type VI secretion system contractile sheath small subunit [Chromobacterium sp. IIBBL 290-4]